MPMDSNIKRPWHTNLLIGYLVLWAAWSGLGMVWGFAHAPHGLFGLADYYGFLLVPMLLGLAAYLLFKRHPLRIVPFMVLPVPYFWMILRLYPNPNRLGIHEVSNLGSYLAQYPPAHMANIVFFLACVVYCVFLNKWASRQ